MPTDQVLRDRARPVPPAGAHRDVPESPRGSLARALLVVSRYEYMPGGLFFIFASAALASLSWGALGDNLDLIAGGTAVWYLSHLIGSQVNCLADVEIDKAEKAQLSDAVIRIGSRRLVVVMAVEIGLTLIVTTAMAIETGKPVLPVLWLIGLALAIAYSVEPVRLKRRGWLNPLSLVLMLYALPMSYGYVALVTDVEPAVIAILVATGLQMLALILLNPAEDIATDRASSIATPCVRHGLHRVAPLAAGAFAAGTVVGLACFADLLDWHALELLLLGVVGCGQLFVLQELLRLARLARANARADGAGGQALAKLVRRNPLHFALLGITLAAQCALILF